MKFLPLHHLHEKLAAKFGEFSGFKMPLYYSKPMEEHHQVRQKAGVFDISHMGQFVLAGKNAENMLQYALPSDVRRMKNWDALYAPLCREDGGLLDDLIIYRYHSEKYRIIVNAGTRERDFAWLSGIAEEFDLSLEDISHDQALLAVQGPESFGRLAPHCANPPGELPYYSFVETTLFDVPVFLARTGYTGEPGCEISVSIGHCEALWQRLTGDLNISPIGLAARDTLRLEACMSLYGHELRECWNPWETGLGWTINLDGPDDFIGKKALRAIKGVGTPYRLAGLEMVGRGVPREGYRVFQNGQAIGEVTSGVMSPTTGKSIALARIRKASAKTGTPIQVEIRGKSIEAVVAPRPFYKNPALKT